MRMSELIIGFCIISVVLFAVLTPLSTYGVGFTSDQLESINKTYSNFDMNSNNQSSLGYVLRNTTQDIYDNKQGDSTEMLGQYDFLIRLTMWTGSLFANIIDLLLLPINVLFTVFFGELGEFPLIGDLFQVLYTIILIVVPITLMFWVIRFITGRDDTI